MTTRHLRKIIGAGDSKAVGLSAAWTDYHDVKLGDPVEVITKDRVVIIKLMEKNEGEGKNGSNGCNKNGELQDQC
jgi:hypothetical protein